MRLAVSRDSFIGLLLRTTAVVAASIVVSRFPNPNPIDVCLPLFVAAAGVAALVAKPRFRTAIDLAIPLLFGTYLFSANEEGRLLFYGVIVASAIGGALASIIEEGRVPLGSALCIVAAAAATIRFIPNERIYLDGKIASILGGLLLLYFFAEGRSVSLNRLLVAFAVAIALPIHPVRASLLPAVIASSASLVLGPSPITVAIAVVIATVGGKAGLPIFLAAAAVSYFRTSSAPESAGNRAVAPVPGFELQPIVRVFAFTPTALLAIRRWKIAVVLLLLPAAGVALRPAIGAAYALAAIVIALALRDDLPSDPATIVFTAVTLCFASWGGAFAALFPLPVEGLWVLAIAAVASLALMAPARRVAPILSLLAAAALVGVIAKPSRPATQLEAQFDLAPTESWSLPLPPKTAEVRVAVAVGNGTTLRRGTLVGTIDLVDASGRGSRRDLRIGEVADWATFRRDQWFGSRNPIPTELGSAIVDFGSGAFRHGAGRVTIAAPGAVAMRITAARDLPADLRILVDAIEVTK